VEHRWGERQHARISARLVCRPSAIGVGLVENLSVSGAYIRTGLVLAINTRVDVELDSSAFADSTAVTLPAIVTRSSTDGLGVEWREFAPSPVTTLLGALPREPARQSQRPLRASCG
jgi:hypothetical protein